ncbi:MAG TPA: TetR/AcrR family transcriptional regulator [Methylocystis sp.]|nr:TetR/AcrR family transcriptional regulator [Methylocystis sp.]
MSAASDTPNARRGEQRCEIVSVAARLFREFGFKKTTVADIAEALGMSPANIYRFFAAKAEINEEVVRQMMREVEEALAAIVNGPGSATERLRALITTNERMNADRYISERRLHEMVEVALEEKWPIVKEHVNRIDALIEAVIASGMKSGEFAPGDAKLAACQMHAACTQFCHPRLMVECASWGMLTSAQMLDFCLAALRAGVPAPPR